MKKYIGIVQIIHERMSGEYIEYKVRTFDDDEFDLMEKWLNLYPNNKYKGILENNRILDQMFNNGIYNDMTPLTKEEVETNKRLQEKINVLIKNRKL